jgi:protein tyrosine phosphatase (PTP) superfamily phosphohydrolase (DUF442 family)
MIGGRIEVGPCPMTGLDLKSLRNQGVKIIICLLTHQELRSYRLLDYPGLVQKYGMTFYHIPVRHRINRRILPPMRSFLAARLLTGKVYIHSWHQARASRLSDLLYHDDKLSSLVSSHSS